MSDCGGGPYPYEAILAGEHQTHEEACGGGCMFEDAAYRAQWAYDKLQERYEALEKEYEQLKLKYNELNGGHKND